MAHERVVDGMVWCCASMWVLMSAPNLLAAEVRACSAASSQPARPWDEAGNRNGSECTHVKTNTHKLRKDISRRDSSASSEVQCASELERKAKRMLCHANVQGNIVQLSETLADF